MKKHHLALRTVLITLLIALLPTGCFWRYRQAGSGYEYRFEQPRFAVSFYIKSVFKRGMWKEAYECLVPEFRKRTSFVEFMGMVREQAPESIIDPTVEDIRVGVTILETLHITDKKTVVYALVSLYYPYRTGDKDRYRVTRLRCHRTRRGWKIEPSVDETSETVLLLPTRFYGPLRQYGKDSIAIMDAIAAEKAGPQQPFEPPPQEPILQPPVLSSSDSETVPAEPDYSADLAALEEPPPEEPAIQAVEEKKIESAMQEELETTRKQQIESLLEVGKLHLETGEVGLAQQSFLKALELDHKNEATLTYLEYCRKYYEIKKEKEKELDIIKSMLNIIGQDAPESPADLGDTPEQ